MDDYTPTTQDVENGYAHDPEAEYRDPVNYGHEVSRARRGFQRWLAEVIRRAREEAWNEGFDEAMDDIGAGSLSEMNPYGLDNEKEQQ